MLNFYEVSIYQNILHILQKQFYTSEDARNAWSNLIMFSSAMLVLPLLTMFTLYHWVFIGKTDISFLLQMSKLHSRVEKFRT